MNNMQHKICVCSMNTQHKMFLFHEQHAAQNMFMFHEQHAAQNMFMFHEQHAAQNMFLFHEQHAAQNHNTQTHTINPLKVWQSSNICE
jgi:hypothetical protein